MWDVLCTSLTGRLYKFLHSRFKICAYYVSKVYNCYNNRIMYNLQLKFYPIIIVLVKELNKYHEKHIKYEP